MTKKAKNRVSRDDWLKAALDILAEEGVAAVKIDRLSRELGVAKTGFYWHFENRQALLQAMLEFWEREYTGVIADNPKMLELPPAQRLQAIDETIDEYSLTHYELAIAAWARSDSRAREILDTTYDRRMRFVRRAFRELGFEGDELEMRARLFVCYGTNAAHMFGERVTPRDTRMRRLRNRLLIQQLTEVEQ